MPGILTPDDPAPVVTVASSMPARFSASSDNDITTSCAGPLGATAVAAPPLRDRGCADDDAALADRLVSSSRAWMSDSAADRIHRYAAPAPTATSAIMPMTTTGQRKVIRELFIAHLRPPAVRPSVP